MDEEEVDLATDADVLQTLAQMLEQEATNDPNINIIGVTARRHKIEHPGMASTDPKFIEISYMKEMVPEIFMATDYVVSINEEYIVIENRSNNLSQKILLADPDAFEQTLNTIRDNHKEEETNGV